jgi:hypothetical protein
MATSYDPVIGIKLLVETTMPMQSARQCRAERAGEHPNERGDTYCNQRRSQEGRGSYRYGDPRPQSYIRSKASRALWQPRENERRQ